MTPGASPGSSSFYRRPWVALLLAVAGIFVAALVVAGWRGVPAEPWVARALDIVVLLSPLVAAVVLAIALAASRGFFRRVVLGWRWTDAVLGLAAGLVMRAIIELVAPTSGTLVGGFGIVSVAAIVVFAIGAVFITPVVEELFFRGIVLAALLDLCASLGRVMAAVVGIAVSSAAFVALHVSPLGGSVAWGTVLAPLLVGLGCGILFALTRRLAAGVVAHVVFNAIGVALLVW